MCVGVFLEVEDCESVLYYIHVNMECCIVHEYQNHS